MKDYNTMREPLILKEYGRNVQMLVNYLKTLTDDEKRNKSAKALVNLMRQINPSIKESTEESQKLWDDLIIMSNFDLEIDGPFPKPLKELLYKKPERLHYKDQNIIYKHYGLNIQLMVDKAVAMEKDEEKETAIIYIGRMMKSFAAMWNKENLDDQVILNNIRELSGGKLVMDIEKVKEKNLFEHLVKEKPRNYERNYDRNNSGDNKKGKRPRRRR